MKVKTKHIAVDFDGTIVMNKFPRIGEPIPGAIETIKTIRQNGHKVFLWSSRYGRKLAEAIEFCESYWLDFDGANHTTSDLHTASPKQYADIYIDDRALGVPKTFYSTITGEQVTMLDWDQIAFELVPEIITKEQYENISRRIKEQREDIEGYFC
jgi:hypothetical protein